MFVTAENDISDQVPVSLFNARAETVPVITTGGAVDNTPLIAGVVATALLLVVSALIIVVLTCTVLLLYKRKRVEDTDDPRYDVVQLRPVPPALPARNANAEMKENVAYTSSAQAEVELRDIVPNVAYTTSTQATDSQEYEYIEPDSVAQDYSVPVASSSTGEYLEILPADNSEENCEEEYTPMASVVHEQVST